MKKSEVTMSEFINKGYSIKPCAFWFWETVVLIRNSYLNYYLKNQCYIR